MNLEFAKHIEQADTARYATSFADEMTNAIRDCVNNVCQIVSIKNRFIDRKQEVFSHVASLALEQLKTTFAEYVAEVQTNDIEESQRITQDFFRDLVLWAEETAENFIKENS